MAIARTSSTSRQRETELDRLSKAVKEAVAKENAALEEKTARLRALRLARDASLPAQPVKMRKKNRK